MSAVSDAERVSMDVLRNTATDEFVSMCERLVEDKIAEWVFDPEVPRVTGLQVLNERSRRALVVVYLDDGPDGEGDFESGFDFEKFLEHY